jgi:hypothetical protein
MLLTVYFIGILPPEPGLRRNRVIIEDWPDPDDDDFNDSDNENHNRAPADGEDQDPPYVEPDPEQGINPEDEPELNEAELWDFLHARLGDLADDEWIDMCKSILYKVDFAKLTQNMLDARNLTARDRTVLQFLASRLRTHFSRQTYDDLRYGACEPLNIPSEFVAWRRLRILSGLETRAYDCCVNSCCCFLGKYRDLDSCPFCQERRFNAAGKARRRFHYSPLIPQLQGLFQRAPSIKSMRYRAKAEREHEPGKYFDVFDGRHYHTLRNTQVREGNDYRFFDNREDIALSLSTNGFTLFKRRRRGLSTAWPIILVNLNLPPKVRYRLENILCVGVIPGPKQCKDLNSFLIPLIEELLELAEGVESSRVATDADNEDEAEEAGRFWLRAFLILLFGDIPAVAKLLAIKGHNAVVPCRTCYIRGVLCQLEKSSVYYVPLTVPGDDEPFPVDALFMRTHNLFLRHYTELEAIAAGPARDRAAQACGINSRSIFASLKSIDMASSTPYDIMHLLFENLVPNLIKLWTGKFKGLDQGTGDYQLSGNDWTTIGRLTGKAARTIPSAFVGTLPNIAEDGNLYKAEAYSFWFQYIAPVVLHGRLPELYYRYVPHLIYLMTPLT